MSQKIVNKKMLQWGRKEDIFKFLEYLEYECPQNLSKYVKVGSIWC